VEDEQQQPNDGEQQTSEPNDEQPPADAAVIDHDTNIERMPGTAPDEQPVEVGGVTDGNVEAVEAPANAEHWREEQWSGLLKLQCNYCNFSTMRGEGEMREHVNRHLKPPKPKGTSGLVGPDGGAL